ncbi:endoribonuclease L-PSP [Colletotrichum tofieldiae]|uniref:Endoribonuclease L-PSP n=1 Tax=Colletotrichum tofieldiae TaxID=708197 RepID=A0A166Y4P2_9PEZI|nr:endoribonuclease L-PSP [Colletotrichum tofieldiae]GKT53972.1 endoribonuclease L-PSP [Colletotrichum tofieldiae]GKT73707.1 endoribonuclease L-PSP [Colletotrichum tofieldiae]GKT95661.1 endoribonuclease L-PSP [Colletotrichum tofieldiae]
MPSVTFNTPPGAGQKYSDLCHYSQSVDLGNGTVKCAGQGGWEPQTGALDANDIEKQVQLALENVDIVLKAAGLRGWEDVYLLRSYHCDIRSSFDLTVEALRKRIPDHRPIWTSIAVPHLAVSGMLIELEVEAKRHE